MKEKEYNMELETIKALAGLTLVFIIVPAVIFFTAYKVIKDLQG